MHGRRRRRKIKNASLVRADRVCPRHGCGGYLLYKGRSKAIIGVGEDGSPVPLICYYRCEICCVRNKIEVAHRLIHRRRSRRK
jgi:hypothetical protein